MLLNLPWEEVMWGQFEVSCYLIIIRIQPSCLWPEVANVVKLSRGWINMLEHDVLEKKKRFLKKF